MATTLAALRVKVRAALRDTEMPYHVGTDEVDESIRAGMTTVGGKVALGEKWVSGAVTVTAGSDAATLPASVEYHVVLALRDSDGNLLVKRTADELDTLYWRGTTATDKGHADPTDYALLEDENGLVTVRFQAPVLTSGTLDLLRSVIPSDLTLPTDAAPLSSLLEQAVSDLAVADLIGKLTKNELDQLRLEKSYAVACLKRASDCIHDELVRQYALQATGRPQRYVR